MMMEKVLQVAKRTKLFLMPHLEQAEKYRMDGREILKKLRREGFIIKAGDGGIRIAPSNRVDSRIKKLFLENKKIILDSLIAEEAELHILIYLHYSTRPQSNGVMREGSPSLSVKELLEVKERMLKLFDHNVGQLIKYYQQDLREKIIRGQKVSLHEIRSESLKADINNMEKIQ